MSQSLVKNLIHLIYSTKNRTPFLTPEIRPEMNSYLAGILRQWESPAIIVNSVEDHAHLPVTEREANQIIAQLAPILPPQCVVFAMADGEPAAFLVALPNLNELLADLDGRLFPIGWLKLLWRLRYSKPKTARVILTGVRPRYRGTSRPQAAGFGPAHPSGA